MVAPMLVSALLLPVVLVFVVVAVQRFSVPVFLALMAATLGYGIAADRQLQAFGRAFGSGFTNAVEQVGLLVVVGVLIGRLMQARALPSGAAAASGFLAALGGSAAGGLALLQPAFADAPRRALLLVFVVFSAHALLAPSPLPVAAAWILHADMAVVFAIGLPTAALAALGAWSVLKRSLPADETADAWSSISTRAWAVVALLFALLIVQAIAQIPSEPLGRAAATEFYTNLGRPLAVVVVGLGLALALKRQPVSVLGDTSWAPLLLAVGAAGGLAGVLDETGMPELWAERVLDPHLGLLCPFLAAAIVKTLQGNSLSAVLTASGMVEPMLPALGLDSPTGRALAAAAASAGSMAVCHVNDPLFWIAASLTRLAPGRALVVISLGSAVVAGAALALLLAIRQFV